MSKKIDGYEVLPCPFCGEKENLGIATLRLGGYFVECQNVDCCATGPADLGQSGAVEKWNTLVTREA